MVGKKRRKFTSEFRSQIVLEVLSGKVSVAQAAKKYKIKDCNAPLSLESWLRGKMDDKDGVVRQKAVPVFATDKRTNSRGVMPPSALCGRT
jgi:transposase-like protein